MAAQLLPHFTLSEQITRSLLHHCTPLGSSTLSSFHPPVSKLPPQSYTILSPFPAQLLHHFTPSEQITPSLLQDFTPLGSPILTSFYPLWTIYPLTFTPFYPPPPLGSPSLTSLNPLRTNYPLTLTPFYSLGSPTLTSFYTL